MPLNHFRRAVLPSVALLAIAVIGLAQPARAGAITDPAGDFIPTFTGVKNGDLDVLSAFATYDGTNFTIGATLNGAVGTTASSLYVFGFNRGAATNNFSAIGEGGVVFDATITLTGAGVTGGRDLVSGTALTVPTGAATISGNSIQVVVPGVLLPSEGLQPAAYGVNLWPRDTTQIGNAAIADFAPNNSDFLVGAATVPEPLSLSLLASGVAGAIAVRWRRTMTQPG